MKIVRSAARLLLPRPIRSRVSISLKERALERTQRHLRRNDAELDVTLSMVMSDYQRKQPHMFFLQVGAFDGVSHDPIHPLIEKYSLRGVLIEPQPKFFEALKANYAKFDSSQFTFINAAIAERDGSLPLYRIDPGADGPAWLRGSASFDKSVLLKHSSYMRNFLAKIQVEMVRSLSFESLYKEAGIEHVDLLQVDAEGYDAEILRLFDLRTRKPAIVRFELMHLSAQTLQDCLNLLISLGYKVTLGLTDGLAYNPEF